MSMQSIRPKIIKDGYKSNIFSLLDVYLDEKGTSVKIQLPNIFKDHYIVAQPTPTMVGYDEYPLSLAPCPLKKIL